MFGEINFVEIFSSFIVMAAIIDIFGSIPIFMSMKEQNKTIKACQDNHIYIEPFFLSYYWAGGASCRLFLWTKRKGNPSWIALAFLKYQTKMLISPLLSGQSGRRS